MDDTNNAGAGRASKPRITAAARARFLDVLAETTSVSLAAKTAGISRGAAYYIHRRDPAFAAQWRAALLAGYGRLEAAMIRHALGEPFDTDGEEAIGKIDVDLAMKLLARHHATVVEAAAAGHGSIVRADQATVGRTLVAKLKAYEKRIAAPGTTR